jgi:predicted transcriptional regulator
MAAVNNELSKYEKVYVVIQKSFPLVWFTSKDIQAAYELEFKEPINLSTVATYFSRMANKGLLMKEGAANRLKYRAVQNISQTVIKQKIS